MVGVTEALARLHGCTCMLKPWLCPDAKISLAGIYVLVNSI